MFFRLLLESFRRQRRRKLLAGAAILLGTTAVTAMLALATTIGDRIHQELAVYGANLIVTPQADALAVKIGGVDLKPTTGNAFLHESDLAKLRGIFWANNITAISPELPLTLSITPAAGRPTNASSAAPANPEGRAASDADPANPKGGAPSMAQSHRDMGGSSFAPADDPSSSTAITSVKVPALGLWFDHNLQGLHTGAPQLHPWWKLSGHWPVAEPHGDFVPVVVGSRLASRLGLHTGSSFDPSQLPTANKWYVTGIVTTGDANEDRILLPLALAQEFNNTPGAVARVEISARTRPEDAFARRDPDTLSPKQKDLWYCRPYANSIAYQIREAIPGANATQLRQVEQTEGTVLSRISGLMWLISAAALLAAGFAVSAAMATAILERRAEIGLMRSLGASRGAIATLFYVESAILAVLAGTLGYLAGSALAAWLGARIFTTATSAPSHLPALNPVLLPVILALALTVAIAGSTPSIRSALRLDPSNVLRSDA